MIAPVHALPATRSPRPLRSPQIITVDTPGPVITSPVTVVSPTRRRKAHKFLLLIDLDQRTLDLDHGRR